MRKSKPTVGLIQKPSTKEMDIMRILDEEPNITGTEVARKLGLEQRQISQKIARLRDKELIFDSGTGDSRFPQERKLALTPSGRKAIELVDAGDYKVIYAIIPNNNK